MLEVEIQKLTTEVASLRELLASMVVTLASGAPLAPAPAPAVKKQKAAQVVEPVAEQEVKPEQVAVKGPSRDEVQELCMNLVREDRSRKADVKEIIASFGGAATLKDVPESDLTELAAKLEALK